MVDFCMNLIQRVFGFVFLITGLSANILSKVTEVVDVSVSIVAGLIAILGGYLWYRGNKVKLENERLENQIKKKQLENLSNTEI